MTQQEYETKLAELARDYLSICQDLDKRGFKTVEKAYGWWKKHRGIDSKNAPIFLNAYAKFQVELDMANSYNGKYIDDVLITDKKIEWKAEQIVEWIKTYVPTWVINDAYEYGSPSIEIDYAWEMFKKIHQKEEDLKVTYNSDFTQVHFGLLTELDNENTNNQSSSTNNQDNVDDVDAPHYVQYGEYNLLLERIQKLEDTNNQLTTTIKQLKEELAVLHSQINYLMTNLNNKQK